MVELINKVTSVIEDSLLFLVEFYLKPVLDYTGKIGYCKVDLCNIKCELCYVGIEVEAILKQEIV